MTTTTKSHGTILVTGATGTVGSEVVKQLSAKGNIIMAAARSGTDNTFKDLKSVQVVQLDYNNPDTLAASFKGVDKLFLLTPVQSNMVDLTSNLVREAKKAGVKHIVKLSVMGADAEPALPWTPGRSHRQTEKIIEESEIPFTFLRPNSFMQNFVTFFAQTIKNQNAFYLAAGDGKVSFVDVRDIGAVAVDSLVDGVGSQHERKAYNITGGEALSFEQAAEILSEKVGKKINYVNISNEDVRKGMQDTGADEWAINSMIEWFGIIKAGYASAISPTVEQITGNKPISFSQFADDYADVFK
jgi:uncharacterized protein YbjT (DUF2867 family)